MRGSEMIPMQDTEPSEAPQKVSLHWLTQQKAKGERTKDPKEH